MFLFIKCNRKKTKRNNIKKARNEKQRMAAAINLQRESRSEIGEVRTGGAN